MCQLTIENEPSKTQMATYNCELFEAYAVFSRNCHLRCCYDPECFMLLPMKMWSDH